MAKRSRPIAVRNDDCGVWVDQSGVATIRSAMMNANLNH